MSLDNQNVTIYQRTTPTLQFVVTDDAGAAKDLSGASLVWKLSDKALSATAHISKDEGDMTVSGAGNNVVSFALGTSETDLDSGRYYHELRADDGTYDVVVATGIVTVRASSMGVAS